MSSKSLNTFISSQDSTVLFFPGKVSTTTFVRLLFIFLYKRNLVSASWEYKPINSSKIHYFDKLNEGMYLKKIIFICQWHSDLMLSFLNPRHTRCRFFSTFRFCLDWVSCRLSELQNQMSLYTCLLEEAGTLSTCSSWVL